MARRQLPARREGRCPRAIASAVPRIVTSLFAVPAGAVLARFVAADALIILFSLGMLAAEIRLGPTVGCLADSAQTSTGCMFGKGLTSGPTGANGA